MEERIRELRQEVSTEKGMRVALEVKLTHEGMQIYLPFVLM